MTEQIFTRHIGAAPTTFNDATNSVRVVAVTENPVRAWDWEQGNLVDQVLLLNGLNLPPRGAVPLLDSHNRQSVSGVLGSARNFQIANGSLECEVFFSRTEAAKEAAIKVGEGHLTDFSVGFEIQDSLWIGTGDTQSIQGKQFTGPVRVITQWYLLELSLTPIGADRMAKARSVESDLIEEIRTIAKKLPVLEQQLARQTAEASNSTAEPQPEPVAGIQPNVPPADHSDLLSPEWTAAPQDSVPAPEVQEPLPTRGLQDALPAAPPPDAMNALQEQIQPDGYSNEYAVQPHENGQMSQQSPTPDSYTDDPTRSNPEPQEYEEPFPDEADMTPSSSGKKGRDIVDLVFYAFVAFMLLCLIKGLALG